MLPLYQARDMNTKLVFRVKFFNEQKKGRDLYIANITIIGFCKSKKIYYFITFCVIISDCKDFVVRKKHFFFIEQSYFDEKLRDILRSQSMLGRYMSNWHMVSWL